MNKQCVLRGISVLMLLLVSQASWALSCFEGGYRGNTRHITSLDREVIVPSTTERGTLLWRSPTYTATFVCYDTDLHPQGEDAYLYWDPRSQLKSIHNSIEVGVTYQSVDINPSNQRRTDIGPGTRGPSGRQFCVERRGRFSRCAQPQTITITYSIYIKATGNPPPASGRITNSGTYSVFQVDGVLGLNTTTRDANFNEYISGLGNIRFVSCNPKITVIGNNGNVVDFGRIALGPNVQVGAVEKWLPFSVTASLDSQESGQQCRGETLMASFSTSNPVQSQNTIMPSSDSGFGIVITPPNSTAPINMNTAVELGMINGTTVKNTFQAGLKWLSSSPKPGRFNATATVDVTFK
ncbi:hypothetical protein R84981_001157 [Carnimonas sp. R-84981]|uniref:fimbrial protein n=2 Tax=Carnimonas bestiolae TaxID=3402172 RepID=UPI003EDB733C